MRVGGSDAAGGQFDDLREVIEGCFRRRFTKQLGGLLLVVLRVVERPGRRWGNWSVKIWRDVGKDGYRNKLTVSWLDRIELSEMAFS